MPCPFRVQPTPTPCRTAAHGRAAAHKERLGARHGARCPVPTRSPSGYYPPLVLPDRAPHNRLVGQSGRGWVGSPSSPLFLAPLSILENHVQRHFSKPTRCHSRSYDGFIEHVQRCSMMFIDSPFIFSSSSAGLGIMERLMVSISSSRRRYTFFFTPLVALVISTISFSSRTRM